MSLFTRGSRAAARPLRQQVLRQQPRRCAHDHGHGHGESALHADSGAKGSESFGPMFYVTLAFIPTFYVGYSLALGDEDNLPNRFFQNFREHRREHYNTDLLHMAAIDQATSDRATLFSFPRETEGPLLKYPEFFNAGSPWNVAAGDKADLTKVHEHYNKKYAEMESQRVSRTKDGKVTTVYDG